MKHTEYTDQFGRTRNCADCLHAEPAGHRPPLTYLVCTHPLSVSIYGSPRDCGHVRGPGRWCGVEGDKYVGKA